ncbi:MAG: hypothetical protein ACK4ZJ_19730, partial [Allorhizobium sp.]
MSRHFGSITVLGRQRAHSAKSSSHFKERCCCCCCCCCEQAGLAKDRTEATASRTVRVNSESNVVGAEAALEMHSSPSATDEIKRTGSCARSAALKFASMQCRCAV